MKEHMSLMQGLLRAVLKDCANSYPHLTREFERDLNHLLTQINSRGSNVLTIELPDLGKHFDKCLSEGQYTPSNLPNGRLINRRHQYPRLFSGLMKLVFDPRGRVLEDADVNAIFFLQTLYYACKKIRLDCSPERRFDAVKEFFSNESSLPTPSLLWRDDNVFNHRPNRYTSFVEARSRDLFTPTPDGKSGDECGYDGDDPLVTLQQVCDRVSASLGEFIPSDSQYRHGPGAVSEGFKLSKFEFPNWTARLDRVFSRQEFGFPTLNLALHSLFSHECDSDLSVGEPYSKLIAVPKTQKGPRLIASEPASHQYAQQGIRRFLVDSIGKSLIRKSVTINDQRPSRAAALEASKQGKSITVDLKSASDRLSCWFVERLFRTNWSLLTALQASRTSDLINDIDKKQPSRVSLKMFAPMGSAVTFPVQSIAYCCITVAAVLFARGLTVTDRNIRKVTAEIIVYGDDIIAPVDCGSILFDILESMWFKINPAKTHVNGLFRESCGMVAYSGVDVTPAYVLEPFDETRPSSISSVVEASNNFFKKGLWECSRFLESTIPRKWHKLLPIVEIGGGAFGLNSFCGSSISHLDTRYDCDTQQESVRCASLSSEVFLTKPIGEHVLFQWFTENPGPMYSWTPGYARRVAQKLRNSWKHVAAL